MPKEKVPGLTEKEVAELLELRNTDRIRRKPELSPELDEIFKETAKYRRETEEVIVEETSYPYFGDELL